MVKNNYCSEANKALAFDLQKQQDLYGHSSQADEFATTEDNNSNVAPIVLPGSLMKEINGIWSNKIKSEKIMRERKLNSYNGNIPSIDISGSLTNLEDQKSNSPPMIVLSNRLPFVLKRNKDGSLTRKASAGGLVTAVAPVVIDCKGQWIGWTGLDDFNEVVDTIPESDPEDKAPTAGLLSKQAVPVAIDPKLFDQYYNGCCNETYWPLFHSMPDKAIFNTDYWKAYTKVNELFALKTLESIREITKQASTWDPAPIIWVHDYHLMLAANTIRNICEEEGMKVRMGFFLHIPFPSFDILRIFPWVDEILMGMLGCNLVGFHTEDYCMNFIDCCQRILGCRVDKTQMIVYNTMCRKELGLNSSQCSQMDGVYIKALPIGIPYQRFETLSKTANRVFPNCCKVILGVDRLDYTKGLVARFRALDRLFEEFPQWLGKVNFLQVAVPSRTDVPEYKELKENIDKLVGYINGKFSTPSWSPIRYIFGSVGQDDLVAFYRYADVALVTPLRDGMNLVAKEFVACQDDNDPGVLILSPFAGAGGLMQEALMANPYETLNVATALDRALKMPLDERKLRMNQLKKRERRMDVDAWVQSFLVGMEDTSHESCTTSHSPTHKRTSSFEGLHDIQTDTDSLFAMTVGKDVEMFTKLGIIVDFDGTLSYLAKTPELAFIAPETKRVLERLSHMPDVNVTIISGREMNDLRKKVGVEGISYAANHGLHIRHPDGHTYNHSIPDDYKLRLNALNAELRQKVQKHGAWVEMKDLLVAWHYREVKDRQIRISLLEKARLIYENHGFEHLTVSKRVENLAPEGWDRGTSCLHILRSLYGVDWEERVKVIYAGDSAADEIAIERLKGVAYTFRVINEDADVITKTNADYRLAGPGGVLSLLKFLEKKLVGKTPKNLSRASSVISVRSERDIREIDLDSQFSTPLLRQRSSSGSNTKISNDGIRARSMSQSTPSTSLRKKTLTNSLQRQISSNLVRQYRRSRSQEENVEEVLDALDVSRSPSAERKKTY